MRKNKYHARKVTVNGIVFDSRKEANRWCELQLLERTGKITELKRQVKFTLIPTQRKFCSEIDKNGRFKKGEVLERPVAYIADFALFKIISDSPFLIFTSRKTFFLCIGR